jgi:antibiotic biosynthesis monooxygenase (ABM) superfamily enzyme
MKRLLATLLGLYVLATAALAQSPSTVIHIINVRWKEDATPEQIKATIDAVHQLPAKYPGIKRVWTKNIKYQAQDNMNLAIVMEFESQDALRKYADSPAQKWWYEMYLPIRDESATHDITN